MDPRFYLLPSLGISLGGQFFVFFQMFFAYTSDFSNYVQEGDRKFTRFLMAEGSVYFGAVAGSYAGGMLYAHFGYQCVFWSSTALNLLGVLYVVLVMKMNLSNIESKGNIFSIKLLTETVLVAFKPRDRGRRALVLLLICSFTLFEMPFPVDDTLLYLYFKDKFNWVEENFTNFQSLWTFSMVIGQFALTPILTKVVRMSEPLIGIFSCVSKGSYYLLLASSSKEWMVYVAAMVGMEGGVGNIVSRSLLARLVRQDELGKIYGLLAILDASLPFAACPIITNLYKATIDTMPGAFCLLNAGVLLVLSVFFLAIYILIRVYKVPVNNVDHHYTI
eukprot:GFUD01022421.1.p1 GENE.GFUD01022421.1~~GFUD01022421.1.p1  ORF type:complete len:371 (+),score=25.84 GFUD01022421.1:115-1113(+)